jgi:hypothetical protein
MAAAEAKRRRNDAASEREHHLIMHKIEHEYDGSLGRVGILKRGLAWIKCDSLAVPAERKRQLRLSTSGRSFHGRGSIYRKERQAMGGKKSKKGGSSGAAHYSYIEDDKSEQKISETQSPANNSHISYIDSGRVEVTDGGDRFSKSNIEGNFAERMRFFELTELFERDSHGDAVTLDLNRPSAAIAATLADPNCDAGLREAMENYPLPHMGEPVRIKLKGSNKDLRRLLTTHGMSLSKIGKNPAKLANDGIVFHTGRSGRTHFRWVFELPVEFTAEQRAMVLEDLGAHMDQEKCMYAAVIHAPDPHNDQRNYHLHLIFYDRPCRRLNGTEADFDNVAEIFQEAIRDEMARGDIKTGEWDFATQRHYLSIRSWKIHYPFRAEKSREITKGKDWQARFRRNYAAIVNDVSARTGGGSVYDPRSYTDRNVDITPSKHLGQLHASEVAGIPTLIGLSNEANQANDDRRAILARHNAEMARLAQLQAKLEPYRPGANVSPIVSTLAKLPLSDIADAKHAADATLAMDLWLLETARERSRATLVHDRQKRASQKGRAHERQQRQELAIAAEMHLAGLDRQDAAAKTMVNCVQYDLDSSRKITAESVDQTAASCANLSRLVAMQPSETITATPTPKGSVAYPALQAGASQVGMQSPASDEAYGRQSANSSIEPVPVQSDKADILAAPGINQSLNGKAGRNKQPSRVLQSLEGPAKPIATPNNAAMAELPAIPAVAPLPGISSGQKDDFDAAKNIVPPVIALDPEEANVDAWQETTLAGIKDAIKESVQPTDQIPRQGNAASANGNSTSHLKRDAQTGIGVIDKPGNAENARTPMIPSAPQEAEAKPLFPITQIHSKQPHHTQAPEQFSPAIGDLDSNTESQPQLMCPHIDYKALKPPMQSGREFHDPAMPHTINDESRKPHVPHDAVIPTDTIKTAFPRAEQPAVARSPRELIEEWSQLGLNELETFDKIAMAGHSLVSTNGVVAFSKPEKVTEIERLCLSAFPKTSKTLFDRQEADRATRTNLLIVPPSSTMTRPVKLSDVRSNDVPTISTQEDSKPKGRVRLNPNIAAVATLQLTTDEQDALIHSFKTARDDKERRSVAKLIRADKITLERMVLRNDPDWVTVDRQYKNQQQLAGAMGGVGGIGE